MNLSSAPMLANSMVNVDYPPGACPAEGSIESSDVYFDLLFLAKEHFIVQMVFLEPRCIHNGVAT